MRSYKIMTAINAVWIAFILVLNYFYQDAGFDFTLKCICSGLFAALGVINLAYAFLKKVKNLSFHICMALGLVFAMLGDVIIKYDFIMGAATFALGHVIFVVAYCFISKLKAMDIMISGSIFVLGAAFLMFCPLLDFGEPIFKLVCVVYALIISMMLGKSIGNLIREKSIFTAVVACASFLFFFSDLMLVLDWFIGIWSWTDHACMGTYYPALCFLAYSMILKIKNK